MKFIFYILCFIFYILYFKLAWQNNMIKSWVINVEKSINKRHFFSSQANNINFKFQFYNAVTPETLHKYDYISDETLQRRLFARPLLKTEIACAISHRNLWQMLVDDDEVEYYYIFEDDTFLNKDFKKSSASLKSI